MHIGRLPAHRIRVQKVRSAKNPNDKATIVSILPRPIHAVKHTIQPGTFTIPAGSAEKPGILVIGPSSWFKDFGNGQPAIEVTCSSIEVAEAIVNDHNRSVLGSDSSGVVPGLFFIPEECTIEDILKDYKAAILDAKFKQARWFMELVRQADGLWATSNNNPKVIAGDMRIAARELNLNDKPWLKDYETVQKVPCTGCGTLKNPMYPICPVCKTDSRVGVQVSA